MKEWCCVRSSFFSHRFSTEGMYTRYWRGQPGVMEQSDADDRLRSDLENQSQSLFTENRKNLTFTGASFMLEK